jgi:short-subunit dehydrogenase
VARSRRSIPENLASGYFRGRTALVTGASSGIGRACAISLSRMGAKVALLARRQAVLEELAAELVTDAHRPLVLPADVIEREAVQSAVVHAINEFGHLDILINSAGILEPGPVDAMPLESLERMMRVNLYGTVNLTQAVLPSMRQAGSGHIVNVASLAGRRGIPSLGGYSATKFAVVGLTEALRVELHGSGVKVSLVLPGVVATPMTAEGAGVEALRGIPPALYAMPVQWVTWAIVVAIAFGLAEVDVPPGAATLEKLGALMPGLTDAVLALALRPQPKASS